MEFRLVLRGALPPHKRGTVPAKHRIRQELHPQLRAFWRQHPALKERFIANPGESRPLIEEHADEYTRCGFRFVPLVVEDVACALDILLLRRDDPYQLLGGAGDLDARVKTLLDGLQMPQQCSEVAGQAPASDEDPFFVLLENDKFVYELNVTTGQLLIPPEPNEPERDVIAIIRVRTRSTTGSFVNIHTHGP